jgi:hypothetical protein
MTALASTRPDFWPKTPEIRSFWTLDSRDLVPDQGQVVLGLQDGVHAGGIGRLVALRTVGADGGTLAGIENPELDAGAIGIERHLAAEGIELKDHVGFGQAADGRIAGHPGGGEGIHGDQSGADAHAGGGQRRLATGMAGTDYNHII